MLTYKLPNANASVITATSTATTLESLIDTAGSAASSLPSDLDAVDMAVAAGGNDILILWDGNTPTTTKGFTVTAGSYISLRGIDLKKLKLIADTGTTAVAVQVGKQGNVNSTTIVSTV